jgi:hypothetical protein
MSDAIINPAYLRDQARRCRRLADDVADEKVRTTLLALALEYEKRAAMEQGTAPGRLDCGTDA